MPVYTIETTFRLPVCRRRSITADTLGRACRLAIADPDWSDHRHDYDNSGATYVSAAWFGDNTAYPAIPMPFPAQFGEAIQRKADHFAVLLDVLKQLAPADAAARAAIAKGEAIASGADDPG